MPSLSPNPRDSHKKWYGVIKPIDDDFWNTALPPNGWNCKCWVQQTKEDIFEENIAPPEPLKGIAGNAGKTGQLFSASHPYIQKLTKEDKTNVASEMKRMNVPTAEELTKIRTEFEAFGKEYEKTFFDDLTGGYVVTHVKHKFDKITGNQEKETVLLFAKNGSKVIFNNESIKDKNGNTLKAVDTLIEGVLTEIKCKNKMGYQVLGKYLKSAYEKGAKSIIISIYGENTISEVVNEIGKRRILKKNFESIYVVKGDKVKRL